MENEIIVAFMNANKPTTLFGLCGMFILMDVLTGYLKALKYKKLNSSVSRDGFIQKIGWFVALLLGLIIDFMLNVNIMLYITAIVLIATEGMSIYENLGEVGVDVPFKKYFERLKENVDEKEDKNE